MVTMTNTRAAVPSLQLVASNEARETVIRSDGFMESSEDTAASTSTATANDIEQSPNSLAPNDKQKTASDIPPDGGYGWVCVGCNFFINGCTWGINSTYAIFLAYYLNHNYFPNTSPLAYAFIGGLSISMAVLIAPFVTWVIHKFGTKACLHIGVFLETVSLIGASFSTQKYQIILAQGICFGFGMGFLFVGSVGIIPQWFLRRRSVANAIAAAGSGFGGLIWSLSTQTMIDSLGLPWAFRVLAICSGTVNLIASNLLRDRNKAIGSRHRSFDFTILRRPEFLIVQAWSWFSMLGYVIVLFSLPAYARAIGLSAKQGSILGAIFNLGQMLGRPFIGLASDRWGRINLAAISTALCGLFCLVFWIPAEITGNPMALLTFFAVVGGGLAGTFWTTIAPVGVEVVGLQDLPSALSWTWLVMVPPVTCAEAIALELRHTGVSEWIYLYAQLFCGLAYVAGGICMWVLRGWKIGELEEKERLDRYIDAQEKAADPSQAGERNEKGNTGAGEVMGHTLTREQSATLAKKAGWKPRVLLKRMLKPKIV